MEQSRLFQMLYYLLDKRKATASELAAYFEVSQRTIYRDINRLSQTGIPVYANVGKHGGIYLDDHFVVDKTIVDKAEIKDVVTILSAFAASYGLHDFVRKIKGMNQVEEDAWIKIDFSKWGEVEGIHTRDVSIIKEGIQKKKAIQFYYMGIKSQERRIVDPTQLQFQGREWYIRGYCHHRKAMRLFRLSRVLDVKITNISFIQHEEIAVISEDIKLETCEFIFDKDVAYRVYDTFSLTHIKEVGNQLFVHVHIPIDEWVYSYLLSMQDKKVVILKPLYLRGEIMQMHYKAYEHFKEDSI